MKLKGQKWDGLFLYLIFSLPLYHGHRCHNSSTFLSGHEYSCLFLNLTLSYLCLLIITWVCNVLFFLKIYFCSNLSYQPALYLISFLVPFVNGVFIHFSHTEHASIPQHACKIHTFPLFVKTQICIFWTSHTILSIVIGRNGNSVSGAQKEVEGRQCETDDLFILLYFL